MPSAQMAVIWVMGFFSTKDSLLDDLEEDLQINKRALVRKTLLFEHALRFLAFATLVELAGRVVQ
jgi:hypothetical protein